MRVKEKEPDVASRLLQSGDTIQAGVTHTVVINGDESWIRFDASTTIGENETTEEATARIIGYVNDAVMENAKAAVETVNKVLGVEA